MHAHDSVSRVQSHLARWKLSEPVFVAETGTSWVYRVERRRTGFAALKILRPEAGDDERYGGDLLDWYGGFGAARVYALSHDAMLLEWLDGGPLSALAHDGQDQAAADIICGIVTQLHAEREMPPPSKLVPLAQRLEALFKAQRTLWPPAARDMLLRAQIIARGLLSSTTEEIALHGDLHHDNILFSERAWLAIDPKGVRGDPAYEFANCFINPFDATEVCSASARIERLSEIFAGRLGLDRSRILGYAAVHAALSACWDLEAKKPVKHQLAILPRLLSAYEVSAGTLY